jgi:NAD(P)-dependent dehydrogenase (short-subunit alcohol dehydrogenase family)
VDAAIAATEAQLGPLTLAVNSAASGSGGALLRTPAAAFAQGLGTELTGLYRCLRAEALAMQRAGGGSIVNVSSIAGVLTHRWMTPYCVAKAGVNMLTRCAADELGPLGIRVNAVMPSLVDTPLVAMLMGDASVRAEYLSRIPMNRLGKPEDVGEFVAALLGDESGWVTGQCIGVDGGHTLRQGPDLVPFFQKFLPAEG